MSGPFKNDGTQVHEYVYDVLVDGGAAAAYVLSDKAGADPVPVGAVVKRVTAKVLTALAGGTAVSWGNGDDADGYSGTAIVDASLTINALFNGYDNAAALLWDDTNYHMIDVAIAELNSSGVLSRIIHSYVKDDPRYVLSPAQKFDN